jgi:hypothetical protein
MGYGLNNLMHDRYYEPEDDGSDLISDRVADLMKSDYDPTNYDTFAECISEAKEADRLLIEEMLKKHITERDYEALGKKLFYMAYERMELFAEEHAQEDYAAGYLND